MRYVTKGSPAMKTIRTEEILYNPRTYGVVAWEDDIYVLSRLPYLDYNDGHAYYANAFRIGDAIQEDGTAPNYRIVWKNPYPPDSIELQCMWPFKVYPGDKFNASIDALIKGRGDLFKWCYKKFISKDPVKYEVFLYSQIAKRKPDQVLRNGIMCPYGFKHTDAET